MFICSSQKVVLLLSKSLEKDLAVSKLFLCPMEKALEGTLLRDEQRNEKQTTIPILSGNMSSRE